MLVVLVALVATARAQEPPPIAWSPIAQVRGRIVTEGVPGDAVLETAQRARAGFEVRRQGIGARVAFQDVRRWAAGAPTGESQPELAEGWGSVAWEFSRSVGLDVKVGRQAVAFHEGRLIGADDFAMRGRFLDAVRLEAHAAPLSVEIVHARGFAADEPTGNGITALRAGATAENPLTVVVADAVAVVDARAPDATVTTGGLYVRVEAGRMRGRAEYYRQDAGEGAASLAALSAGWVFGPGERLALHARYEGASGDVERARGDGVAWTPVLEDSRTFRGIAGRFADLPDATDRRGLADLHGVLEYRPSARVVGRLAAHRFWSPVDDVSYGTEVDATVDWAVSAFAGIGGGAAAFQAAPSFTPGDLGYGWVELHVAF